MDLKQKKINMDTDNDLRERLTAEVKRVIRLYSRAELAEKIVDVFIDQIGQLDDADDKIRLLPTTELAQQVIENVCTFYGISFTEVIKRGRKKERVHVRKVIMYLLCQKTRLTLMDIGRLLVTPGAKPYDHTSILHHRDDVRGRMRLDKALRYEIRALGKIRYRETNEAA